MLTENGYKQDINEDLDIDNEKTLGKFVEKNIKLISTSNYSIFIYNLSFYLLLMFI